MLLFRNQKLTDQRLNEVASLFGEVRALPGGYIGEENVFGVRHLTNLGPDNKPTGIHPERWSKVWHTDGGFSQPPAKATLLYAIESSRDGGATQFADMYGGLEAFTESERRKLETLDAIHDQELARVFRFRACRNRESESHQMAACETLVPFLCSNAARWNHRPPAGVLLQGKW